LYCILTSGRLFDSPYGEEKYTLSLGRWLSKKNSEVVVIGTTFTSVKAKYFPIPEKNENKKDNHKKIRALNPPYIVYIISRLYLSLLFFFKILSINKKTPIKLINAQDSGYSGLAAVITSKIMKIPVIVSTHNIRHKMLESILDDGMFKKILLKIEYNLDIFTIKNADMVIAVNPEIKRYYEKIVGKTIDFIPNPIKMKNFVFSLADREFIRKELGVDDRIKLVGYVGRLSPEKNLITLINSVAKAIQDNPLIRLVIIGTGSYESHLRDEIRKHHLEDKVIFCGLRNDISRVLSGLDIFVLPSYTEGLSSALLEAMSCERAIICSNIAGNQVLVAHNKEGLLFNPYDSQELIDAIQLLSTDDSLRSRLGNDAKIKASEYDEDIVFPKILHLYSTLIKKKVT